MERLDAQSVCYPNGVDGSCTIGVAMRHTAVVVNCLKGAIHQASGKPAIARTAPNHLIVAHEVTVLGLTQAA